jgi:signal transduction histidine kinase
MDLAGVTMGVVAGALPVPVEADVTRLAQAVEQVLRNAVLFTAPVGGGVTVRVSADPLPAVEIADTGVGIPPAELPYVFDRFYRGRYARDQAVPGAGLGLPIARAVVESHRGTLRITPVSVGTVVRITLPRP